MPTRSPGADARAVMSPPPAVQAVTVVPATPAVLPQIEQLGALAGAIVAILGLVALIARLLTRDVVRDLGQIKHKLGNQAGRLDAIEHGRAQDIERIVRVEGSIQGLEKAVERMERSTASSLHEINANVRELLQASVRHAG